MVCFNQGGATLEQRWLFVICVATMELLFCKTELFLKEVQYVIEVDLGILCKSTGCDYAVVNSFES